MSEATQQAAEFVPVEADAELEGLFARSDDAPVVIFKHSTTCPISAHAHGQMRRLDRAVVGEIALVVVQRARGVSNEVARRTGLRHESPQAIVLRRGQPVWSASHFDITTDAVERAVRENS
jgi:bacillithiol system protein YtxJ